MMSEDSKSNKENFITAVSSQLFHHSCFITAVSSSLIVLNKLIEINQSAQVIEDFIPIVETISACITEECLSLTAQQSLTRIRRRLETGASFPHACIHKAQQQLSPKFEISQDLPGHLSSNSARHDNDHASICDIQILPTAQEINCQRQEYLPLADLTQHHLPGLAGLLDRQFRLLREDTIGQLRDAVREELIRLQHVNHNTPLKNPAKQGVRRLIYHNATFSRLCIDRKNGLRVVVEFDQPSQVIQKSSNEREEWWKASKLLQIDSLVCFVSSTGKIIFFCVHDPVLVSFDNGSSSSNNWRKSIENPTLYKDPKRASVVLGLTEYKAEDTGWFCAHMTPSKAPQSLVEFPGVLLPSFKPTLEALKEMNQELDLPFADIVAPNLKASTAVIAPPLYASKSGFSYNLDILAGVPLTLSPGQPFDFAALAKESTLDEDQQVAVIQALLNQLALIQGPPGTGKSYTGTAIVKALLRNRAAADLGPTICVCYTNHALDQLLEHLIKDGVTQVIRLGLRSKSDLLQNLTLRHVAEGVVHTKTEKRSRWKFNLQIDEIVKEIEEILPELNNLKSWTNIQAHLLNTHPQHHEELFGEEVDDEGFQEVRAKRSKVIENWLRGTQKIYCSNRAVAELLKIPLKEMSRSERATLHMHWIKQRSAQITKDLLHALDSYHTSKTELNTCHKELDLRCLREAHIIGVTTSGLARNIDLLRRVRAKVMLCEEAGEVLEAHTLTAFLPSVEHAILIGDHQQLRPQINNYELQHDNPMGERYSLDILLFERLVKQQTGVLKIPLSTLKTQRRMHPTISELVRVPLYPNLRDHHSVKAYPDIVGMRDRLYWLDHQEIEDPRPAQSISMSRTNNFEVEMAAALVSHLVRQGTYRSEDIAIITPYLGQLQKLKRRLARSFEIVVGEKDQEEVESKGLQDDPDVSTNYQIQVHKTTLLKALRLATVDNFQGEEAKVIIASLVRSNKEQKCGLLRTSNRINVLLSRAKHGMYIIGNSNTSRFVPMWNEVVSILERANNIGPSLALCCPRHKETPIKVSVPDDFARFAPEGGCAKRCLSRLLCGHACPNLCQSTSLHNAVHCIERCQGQRRVANTSVLDLVEIHARRSAKSCCLTLYYHVDMLLEN